MHINTEKKGWTVNPLAYAFTGSNPVLPSLPKTLIDTGFPVGPVFGNGHSRQKAEMKV